MNEKFKKQISDILDLTKDEMLNLSRITMTGQLEVFIENHKGIIEYDPKVVRVNTLTGVIAIKGEKLFIKDIIHDEITIEGLIKGMEFED